MEPSLRMQLNRGGFWARLGAYLIDFVIVTAIVQVMAMILYPHSGGQVQATGFLRGIGCQTLAAPPVGVSVPPELEANRFEECRVGILGLEYAHTFRADNVTAEGVVTSEGWTVMLDQSGKVVAWPLLDVLVLPLFMLWRAVTDGRSAGTLGRKATGLKLVTGEGSQPGFGKALGRQVLLWWPVLAGLPLGLTPDLTASLIGTESELSMPVAAVLGPAVVVWFIAAIVMIVRRRDPLYDRWVGTAVVARE
jgi:uncharacterized RDD family membrane protein YckC